jgi:hypothetical protein
VVNTVSIDVANTVGGVETTVELKVGGAYEMYAVQKSAPLALR